MKKLLSAILIVSFLSNCDKIEPPYISGEVNPVDTTSIKRNILIEDFTGHTCPNCPDAAAELESIHAIYGDQIIGIALHVGNSFARPYPSSAGKFQYDFRTKWGEEINSFFSIEASGLPNGMVNRIDYPESHKKGKEEWNTEVQDILNSNPKFSIEITASSSSINTTIEALENVQGNYNLIVCLTESGIVNWQKDGGIEIEDYTHNHVLRSMLNGTWGEPLKSSVDYTESEKITKSIAINLSELEQFNINHSQNNLFQGNGNSGGWNLDNIHVIAYVYDVSSYEIMQVEEIGL